MTTALGAPVESFCVSAAPSRGRWLNLHSPSEPAWVRWVFGLLGLATAVAFLVLVLQYHEPGPCWPGIDENAYLLGGKNFAHTLTTGMKPPDPYAYVSMMWFRTDQGWYYPKYPLGVPLLHALAVTVGQGNQAAFYTSPVCATLAVLAMFLLTRLLAGSVAAWLAAVLLAANPTVLYLAMVPSSHAPALCFCLWGMYALFRWWRWGNVLVGMAAGLLLGFTAMIRYSEGLLGLPLALAALSTVRWRQWRSYVRSAAPVLAWAVPVGSLLLYNWLGSGHLTGYDSTNESVAGAAFTWKHFASKWEFTLQQLHMYGLFCILPLGVLAILLMFSWSWRAALALVLWLVPSVLLYMAYYWGRQAPGVGYLRFFLTVYPALIAAALWLISQAARGLTWTTHSPAAQPSAPSRARLVGAWLGGAAYTAAIATVGIYVALPDLQQHYKYNANLAFSAKSFLQAVPQARHQRGKPVPIIFCDEGGMFSRLLMHMQFAADGQWYSVNAFTPRGAGRSMMRPPSRNQGDNPDQIDHPVLVQPARQQITRRAYEDKSPTDLAKLEADLVQQALSQSRGVYALLSQSATSDFTRRMRLAGFECKVLSKWTEPIGTTQPASRWPFLGGQPGDRSNRGFGRPGRFGADMNTKALSPPGRGFMRFGDMAQSLQVVQVLKQAPEQP